MVIFVCFLLFTFIVFASIRINISYKNQMIIMDAIHAYNIHLIIDKDYSSFIPYQKMESLENTVFRFWDFGYKRIVDHETYEMIKPYIKTK